ncbi:hypothetical protein AALP_AA1G199800 [Arabis alpina]|uniref:Uncharacterized protein n=1 Tax=Arabis alpina TaxID=50452 RepID=A0A087HPD3_ARAAL|nr:hypothetical protein AALP_AA1G199800 [Arabis alpina]
MGEMSPKDYAKQVCAFEPDSRELAYEMIVADINTNSMYNISKVEPKKPKVHYEEVGFGVHTLSSTAGFDNPYSRTQELLMKHLFNEIIVDCKKEPVPTPEEMAKRFIYDPASEVEKSNFKTVSTTALVVKPTKEVMLYERYLVNGDWKEHGLEFKIE